MEKYRQRYRYQKWGWQFLCLGQICVRRPASRQTTCMTSCRFVFRNQFYIDSFQWRFFLMQGCFLTVVRAATVRITGHAAQLTHLPRISSSDHTSVLVLTCRNCVKVFGNTALRNLKSLLFSGTSHVYRTSSL